MLFTPVALIIAFAGLSNPLTALGAEIYFYSRVVHAVTYAAGITYIRTIAWVAGIVGLGMMVVVAI